VPSPPASRSWPQDSLLLSNSLPSAIGSENRFSNTP
jgi:hypothetical protein